jgi:hypothetical protein
MRNAKITSTPTFPFWTIQKAALYTRQTRERGQKTRERIGGA